MVGHYKMQIAEPRGGHLKVVPQQPQIWNPSVCQFWGASENGGRGYGSGEPVVNLTLHHPHM